MSTKQGIRSENGAVLVLAALLLPVALLLAALVTDVGNWYTHKRQLQNRADAAVLAAGVEYIKQIKACQTTPGVAGIAISDVAKNYSGDPLAPGVPFNTEVAEQSDVTVKINATDIDDLDFSDGGNPCYDHPANAGDPISPNGGLWTDAKVREVNLRTLLPPVGLNLNRVVAQARVELKQIVGISARGLPFVEETGDQIECVWAQFVRARDGSTAGFTVTPSNPIALTGGPYTWTGAAANLQFTNAHDDVAIRYWAGSRDGNAPCDWNSPNRGPVPHAFGSAIQPEQIDWINVYDDGAAPGADTAPKLRRFSLSQDTCGGPGYLYTQSIDPNVTCRVGFTATVDTGPNAVQGEITVSSSVPDVSSVSVAFSGSGQTMVSGTITIRPNEVASSSSFSQDYTQVGMSLLSVSWRQTSGKVGNKNCTAGNPCTGTFQGETVSGVSNVQHAIYMSDPLTSVPLTGTSLNLSARSFPAQGQTGAFTITFQHTAVDPDHIVLIRDSVQSSGNRTRAIWCGNGPGKGAAALGNAIRDGCLKDLVLNQRQDSCSPPPPVASNPWDCVQLEQGNKSSIAKGAEDRFQCTPNRWPNAQPGDGDQRWAYIILTGYGRTFSAGNNDWLPIEGLVLVYVTGWDRQGGGGGPASCASNDDPPRGYDSKGAQLWGHIVSPITLDDDVITTDAACDTSLNNIQCKPTLVR